MSQLIDSCQCEISIDMEYKYMGNKFTDKKFKDKTCAAVHWPERKCTRGKNGSMLVDFAGEKVNVIGRLLRKQVAVVVAVKRLI